jgi:dipeptidyl aminopeptidase/acylaminoacyl peptidase
MKTLLNYFLFVILLMIHTSLSAKSWEMLFEHSQYQGAKISPDGLHLAVSIRHKERVVLVFFRRETMKSVGQVSFQANYEPGEYTWVNNERVVIQLVKRIYSREKPISYGELFAVNFDGSKGEMIFGMQAGEMQTGSRLKKKKTIYGWGEIIDVLPEDPEHILVSSTPMSNTGERLASALKLNVYSGIVKRNYGRAPISFAEFLTNTNGKPVIVSGVDKHNDTKVFIKKDNGWEAIPSGILSERVNPLSLSPSGKYLYTIDNHNQDRRGIFKLNLEDYSYKSIFTDKTVDITDVEMTTNGRLTYALRVDEGYPSYIMLNKKSDEAKIFKMLLQSFPYSKVNITSRTDDSNLYIVHVSSDINLGSLYIFDKKQNTVNLLFKYSPNIDSKSLLEMEPIKITTSDNTKIHGYFTAAKSSTNENPAPVVVMVHGGPHGVRDHWGFSSSVQYLALNGYSVLQVNYRGSGGYGRTFEVAGHQTWGTLIQRDIYDSYQWLIKQGKASEGNVCIMGGSFGAYSAIQSAATYPNTYKCAIANAGIYDLELMFEEGDIQARRSGMSYLRNVLGTDKQKLKAMSPVNYVENIKVPILLAHGEDDDRAPFKHAERLRNALDNAKKPYEWYVVDKEGHGFYNPENQKTFMKKVLSFLNQHLNKQS